MSTETAIPNWLAQLRARLAELSSPSPSPELGAGLLQTLAAIQRILTEHRKEMPPDLVHFLERRSYEKAAHFCAGVAPARRETCGAKY